MGSLTPPTLNAAETLRHLPLLPLLSELRRAVQEYAQGAIACPERLVVPLPQGGVMLCMPAVAADLAAHKLVNVCRVNQGTGLPTIQGSVTAYDALHGTPLFTLDAPTVTARRTAAISLLGIEVLHGPPSHVAVIGTGGQASGHLAALHELYPATKLSVVGRTPKRAEEFKRRTPVPVQVADTVPADADVVITATTSPTPVYDQAPRRGRLVIGVGAFTPNAAEISAQVVQDSDLFVDDPAGARHEAGDFLQVGVNWQNVRALADALSSPPDLSRPIVLKTVGCAAWDLAACRVVLTSIDAFAKGRKGSSNRQTV